MKRTHGSLIVSLAPAMLIAGVWLASTRPVAASLAASHAPAQNVGSDGSALAGVFTADQATKGQETFQKTCAACHTVAEHTGRKFEERWTGSSVGDLFEFISSTMPDGNPGSLEPAEYASVVAYFLKETGYPEGKDELPSESEPLKKLKIEPLPH